MIHCSVNAKNKDLFKIATNPLPKKAIDSTTQSFGSPLLPLFKLMAFGIPSETSIPPHLIRGIKMESTPAAWQPTEPNANIPVGGGGGASSGGDLHGVLQPTRL